MGFLFSSPAVVELAILIVVAVGKAVYKLYKYFTKKEKLCKASKDIKVSENEPLNQADMEKMVTKWEPLNISQAELKNVQALTNSLFEKKAQSYTCPITQLIIREPARTNCCGKLFQFGALVLWIQNIKKNCPNCRKTIGLQNILIRQKQGQIRDVAGKINEFRVQIRKTLSGLSHEEFKQWKENVEMHFGYSYTANDL